MSENEISIDEIVGPQTKQLLMKVVKNQMGSENVEIYMEPGSKKGQNFMGEVYRILYKNTKTKNESSSLILKIAPRHRISSEKMKLRNMFLREIQMYDEIFPLFDDLQLSHGIVPKVNGFNEVPKCYGNVAKESAESALFLEDLKSRNFEVIDLRSESLTFEHVSLIMKALGRFHAMSFALRDQHPDRFNELKGRFPEGMFFANDEKLRYTLGNLTDRFETCLEKHNRFDLLKKFKRIVGDDPRVKWCEYLVGADAEPYSVICHGDLTTNNIMFRKDEHGKAVEIQLLDWQFSRYASPVTELVLCLFCSTTKEMRDKHYDDFLNIYYKSLSDLLSRLGSDPQKLFPYEALLDQFKQFGAYAVLIGAGLMPVLFADRNTMPGSEGVGLDSDMTKLFIVPDDLQDKYDQMVIDLIEDVERFGYI